MFQTSSVVRLGNASVIGVSSLVKDLNYRARHLNLCNKEISPGTQHNQHW